MTSDLLVITSDPFRFMSFQAATPVTPERIVRDLTENERVRRAFRFFEKNADSITEEHISISSIPAPPFGEGARAEYLRSKFVSFGLTDASIDTEGNCVALRSGRSGHPLLVVSAHLDTVFPPATDFTVRRDSPRLRAPGVADDGCGLAALMTLASVLGECGIATSGSILFVGTVGEEGEGNLRGVRHLLTEGEWAGRVDSFISIDGPGIERITNAALGSRRYRVRMQGTGGHSWGDFGAGNPIHALGRAVARLAAYPVPQTPRTTFNVGRIAGGTGVNVIPFEASMDVDLRSESAEELSRLDAYFRRSVREAAEDENAARRSGTPPLSLEVTLIGERPSGQTRPDSHLVKLAEESTRALGVAPRLECSSTDSNIAISLGLPAVTVGAGGASGNSHTLDEWYDPRGRDAGLKRALILILGIVGMES